MQLLPDCVQCYVRYVAPVIPGGRGGGRQSILSGALTCTAHREMTMHHGCKMEVNTSNLDMIGLTLSVAHLVH